MRDGNVAELYGRLFDEGEAVEGDRSDDGDDFAVDRIERQEGEDRRMHPRRLSQSLTSPWETLTN